MSPVIARRRVHREVELIEQFAGVYRKRLAQIIEQLNHSPSRVAEAQSLRLCIETMDMLLASYTQLAKALADSADAASVVGPTALPTAYHPAA